MADLLTTREAAVKVYWDGLENAILHAISPEAIGDAELSAAWGEARTALRKVEALLPNVEMFEQDDIPDV